MIKIYTLYTYLYNRDPLRVILLNFTVVKEKTYNKMFNNRYNGPRGKSQLDPP